MCVVLSPDQQFFYWRIFTKFRPEKHGFDLDKSKNLWFSFLRGKKKIRIREFKIAAETMAEYDASQFHLRNLKCVLSLDDKQA